MSIDSFGALDTTRIFYIKSNYAYKLEQKIVNSMKGIFLINRTSGGIGSIDTYTNDLKSAKIAVVAGMKKKNLIPFVTLDELRNVLNEKTFQFYLRKYPELNNLT